MRSWDALRLLAIEKAVEKAWPAPAFGGGSWKEPPRLECRGLLALHAESVSQAGPSEDLWALIGHESRV